MLSFFRSSMSDTAYPDACPRNAPSTFTRKPDWLPRSCLTDVQRMPLPVLLKAQNERVDEGTVENKVSKRIVSFENVRACDGDMSKLSSSHAMVRHPMKNVIMNNDILFIDNCLSFCLFCRFLLLSLFTFLKITPLSPFYCVLKQPTQQQNPLICCLSFLHPSQLQPLTGFLANNVSGTDGATLSLFQNKCHSRSSQCLVSAARA